MLEAGANPRIATNMEMQNVYEIAVEKDYKEIVLLFEHFFNYPNDALPVFAKFDASSSLSDSKIADRYSADKAFDGNPLTSWVEGHEYAGTGEYVEVIFDQEISIDAIEIMPGFFDERYWIKNNRIKDLGIQTENSSFTLPYRDEMAPQTYHFDGFTLTFKEIAFRIGNIYRGTSWDDTCIAEISFFLEGEKINVYSVAQYEKEFIGTQLEDSAFDGDAMIVGQLLSQGIDPDKGQALAWAAVNGHTQVMQLLIDAGADLNLGGPLVQAIANKHWNAVDLLLERGADFGVWARRKFSPNGPFRDSSESDDLYSPSSIVVFENKNYLNLTLPFEENELYAENPTLVASFSFGAEHRVTGVAIRDNYAFLGVYGKGLVVMDISNPQAQRQIAELALDPVRAGDVYITPRIYRDTVYATDGENVHIIDIRKPGQPKTLATILWTNARRVVFWENYLYVQQDDKKTGKVSIYDIGDPAEYKHLMNLEFDARIGAPNVHEDILYLAIGNAKMQRYNLKSDGTPEPLGRAVGGWDNPLWGSLFFTEQYIISVGGDAINISNYRFEDLNLEFFIGGITAVGQINDFLFLGNNKITKMDISNPTNPSNKGAYKIDQARSQIRDLAEKGRYIFAAADESGLLVFRY